jgi:hypothetical protein
MARSKFYVVNVAGGGRQSSHIVNANVRTPYHPNPWHPGNLVMQLTTGFWPVTLCGLRAGRRVDVFAPGEASCRECRKRWQLRAARDASYQADEDETRQAIRLRDSTRVRRLLILFGRKREDG